MKEKLTNYLRETYPDILGDVYFECGDGWFLIIDALCSQLNSLADRAKTEPPTASQIKQKFGGLRFHIDPLDPLEWGEYVNAVYAVVGMAERLSCTTSESSGRPYYPPGGWRTGVDEFVQDCENYIESRKKDEDFD